MEMSDLQPYLDAAGIDGDAQIAVFRAGDDKDVIIAELIGYMDKNKIEQVGEVCTEVYVIAPNNENNAQALVQVFPTFDVFVDMMVHIATSCPGCPSVMVHFKNNRDAVVFIGSLVPAEYQGQAPAAGRC